MNSRKVRLLPAPLSGHSLRPWTAGERGAGVQSLLVALAIVVPMGCISSSSESRTESASAADDSETDSGSRSEVVAVGLENVIRDEMERIALAFVQFRMQHGTFPPSDPANNDRYLRRLFPRASEKPADFDESAKALVFWLSRVSTNPSLPFSDPNKDILFDFDPDRLTDSDLTYLPPGSSTPYVYVYLDDSETFQIQWPGMDGVLNTADDIVVNER
jgi:hypothetical protein